MNIVIVLVAIVGLLSCPLMTIYGVNWAHRREQPDTAGAAAQANSAER